MTLNTIPYPCVVIDGLADVWDTATIIIVAGVWFIESLDDVTIEALDDLLLTVRVDILNDAGIMVVLAAVIDLELVVGVARDVDGLTAA